MSRQPDHIDALLRQWKFRDGEVQARRARGEDGRELLQLRVDLGVLQLETSGRPDGEKPNGFVTLLAQLSVEAGRDGDDFELSPRQCTEIDREFVQFYHRRVCWLALGEFANAARDADHTLALMDFSKRYGINREWVDAHEQYRPFVLFHRAQATALAQLEKDAPTAAFESVRRGIEAIRLAYAELGVEPEQVADDEFVERLAEMQRGLSERYELSLPLSQSLEEQLAEAIANERYELAAELRDRIAQTAPQPRGNR